MSRAACALAIAAAACGAQSDMGGAGSGSAEIRGGGSAAPEHTLLHPTRDDLLAAIPADAPYGFVAGEPNNLLAWLSHALDPATVRAVATANLSAADPIRRVELAALLELADAIAAPQAHALGLGSRFAIFGTAALPLVVRVEVVDPAAAASALAHAMTVAGARGSGSPWLVDDGSDALAVALRGDQLTAAYGPSAAVVAAAPELGRAVASPVTEQKLFERAAAHGFDARAIGWIDPAGYAALAAWLSTPACGRAVSELVAGLGAVTIGVPEFDAQRIAIAATVDLDFPTASALVHAAGVAPTLPCPRSRADRARDRPLFALTATMAPELPRWVARLARVQAACGDVEAVAAPPASWRNVQSVTLAVYDGAYGSDGPRVTDGLVALASPHLDALVRALAPYVTIPLPRDGGGFATVASEAAQSIAPGFALERRGGLLIGATAGSARARAADLVPRSDAPLLRVAVAADARALFGPEVASDPADDGVLDQIGLGSAIVTRAAYLELTAFPDVYGVRTTFSIDLK